MAPGPGGLYRQNNPYWDGRLPILGKGGYGRPCAACPYRPTPRGPRLRLLDYRQDNQCQSRPPQSDAPRKRRTRATETRPLSQITRRKNVARQSPEDTCLSRLSSRLSKSPACEKFLYGFKAARWAARAAASARSPSLPLTLPLRRRPTPGRLARKSRKPGRLTYSKLHRRRQGTSLLPLPELSGASQNPSRPSVTAGQPHLSSCVVNVHAKTALTEPPRPRKRQRSEAWTGVARPG